MGTVSIYRLRKLLDFIKVKLDIHLKVLFIFFNIIKKNGYLFSGHVEKISEEIDLFKNVKPGDSFLYIKE
ncbi:hypothetical protein [Persephonella sp.]